MKRIALFTLLSFIASSCTEDQNNPETSDQLIDMVFSAGLQTKTSLVESSNSVIWSSDDAISVFSSSAPDQNMKFTSFEINGSQAKFQGQIVESSTYYALYPYNSEAKMTGNTISSSIPENQTAIAGSFQNQTNPSFAVSKGNKLSFNNICSLIRIKMPHSSSPITQILLSGNNGENLAGKFSFDTESEEPAAKISESGQKTITLSGTFEDGKYYYFVIAPVTFENGFSVTFKGGKEEIRIEEQNNITIPAGKVYSLENMQIEKPENDLSESEAANCYIVSGPGEYAFRTVMGNSSQSIGQSVSAEVLWESFGTNEAPQTGALIKSANISGNYVVFNTADEFKEGNAVIAVKDNEQNVLWSWHIWLVSDEIAEHNYANNAGTMMDRNLGATSSVPGEVGALGLLYQWGRKDPFLGSSNIATEDVALSTIEWPTPVASSALTGTVSYAVTNPTVFITKNTTDANWIFSSPDNSLWDENKTIYDPCPAGWQVPDGGPNGIWARAGFPVGKMPEINGGANKGILYPEEYCGAEAWYPAAGNRNYADGIKKFTGGSGFYWSTTPNFSNAFILRFDQYGNFENYENNNMRSFAFSIRCMKIE